MVALVGYTNAGKSTLFNRLTGAEVLVKDMLFATLDPTMRSVELPDGLEIIMSDTVGFISDLPTQLVAAFRATLEEVLSADLVLHVRDISHPESEGQARDVRTIMAELGVDKDVPVLEVWNKSDRLAPDALETATNKADRDEHLFLTSAITGAGIDELLDAVSTLLRAGSTTEVIELGFADGKARAWLFGQEVVDSEEQTETGFNLTVTWNASQKGQFEKL